MATAYLEPTLSHSVGAGVKSRLSVGTERSNSAPDRVLKVFHHFENNSENSTWCSNIRHGDGTDVRVSKSDPQKQTSDQKFQIKHMGAICL